VTIEVTASALVVFGFMFAKWYFTGLDGCSSETRRPCRGGRLVFEGAGFRSLVGLQYFVYAM
jgi:hypothetical protein